MVFFAVAIVGLLGVAFKVQNVESGGTIYIRAGGSVDPRTAPISSVDNTTYVLISNIDESIVVERDDIVVDGDRYTVQGTQAWESKGIHLSSVCNVTIMNVIVREFWFGIYLNSTSHSVISGDNITQNHRGIQMSKSSHNRITENNITENVSGTSIYDGSSGNAVIRNNIVENGWDGIQVFASFNNTVYANNITDNSNRGIFFRDGSAGNIVVGNRIANNHNGIRLVESAGNSIYHNSFVGNTLQINSEESVNIWDDGYPSGGNYWSDYQERYPNATEIDDSDIWNTPYVIDQNNQDGYPLIPEFPAWTSMPLLLIVATVAIAICTQRLCHKPTKME